MVEPLQAGSNQNTNIPLFHSTDSSTDMGESHSLAKVRDILFGHQMREVERRFTRLEERLLKECADLRDETRKRLDSLETYIKKEVESIADRLKNEQVERGKAVKAVAEENKNITMSLEKRIAQFEEETANSQREVREQILNQSKSLQDDIRQKYEEIVALVQQESQELRIAKTDRSSLATLFSELAIRLNSQQQ
jgi:phage gp36-like protein